MQCMLAAGFDCSARLQQRASRGMLTRDSTSSVFVAGSSRACQSQALARGAGRKVAGRGPGWEVVWMEAVRNQGEGSTPKIRWAGAVGEVLQPPINILLLLQSLAGAAGDLLQPPASRRPLFECDVAPPQHEAILHRCTGPDRVGGHRVLCRRIAQRGCWMWRNTWSGVGVGERSCQ